MRMGKGRKNRVPQPGSAPTPTQPAAKTSVPKSSAPAVPPPATARRIGMQFAALLCLSAVLGFTFNSANPIGVRFGKPTSTAGPVTGSPTNFNLTSTASVAVIPSQPVVQPAPQPLRQPAPMPPHPSRLPTVSTQLQTQTVATATPSLASNPTVVISPTAQTNLNPASIHWREAKPLVASGQALLVDVRLAAVYDAGHIPDAISLPETSKNEEVDEFLKQVPTNLTLIVYCSSTSCSQSKRVADRLVGYHKWPSVKYMTGGYLEYQQEELARSQPQQ